MDQRQVRQNVAETRAGQNVDVVVVGGGMAGLTAAHALRDLKVVVLEANTRVGGRVKSEPTGDVWLNYGAHMMGGAGTHVGALISELGLEARPIGGRLAGMIHRERALLDTPASLYPFALSLSLKERAAMVKLGLALRAGAARAGRNGARAAGAGDPVDARRIHRAFENERTLADFVGPLPSAVAEILRAITERTGADPTQMACGHGLRSLTNVWAKTAPGFNIVGGSGRLPQALAARLGAAVRTGCVVEDVRHGPAGVTVRYSDHGEPSRLTARAAVVATPAAAAAQILGDAPADLASALRGQSAGPFLSAAIPLHQPGPAPWDGVYAIATPGRSFSVVFNMATTLPLPERQRGGSLMLFRGALGAARLMDGNDKAIETAFRADLYDLFPGHADSFGDLTVSRWPAGAPYLAPGTAAGQAVLDRGYGQISLAGDYLEFPNLEAALGSAHQAAATARRLVSEQGS